MGLFITRLGWRQWFAGSLACVTVLAHAGDAEFARVIVKLKPDASVLRGSLVLAQSTTSSGQVMNPMGRLGARRGLTVQDGRGIGNHMHVATARGVSSEALAASLSKDSDVLFAVPDRMRKPMAFNQAPTDPLFGNVGNAVVAQGQWYLRAYASASDSAINAQPAWSSATGDGVTVAVLDTGVRFDHPDLQAKLLQSGYNMIQLAPISGVSGGRNNDASDLGDWVTQTDADLINAANPSDSPCTVDVGENDFSSWHGTQVSGIIAAQTNNGIGMASVAPDAMLLPVRVLGKCGGWDSDILAGMRWAAGLHVDGIPDNTAHRAKVLNMSLGAPGACPASYKAVLAELSGEGVVVVAAAGNNEGLAAMSPANCAGVIGVTGVRHIGTKVKYADVGPEVSVAAPGGNCVNLNGACLYPILTTSNTGETSPDVPGATYSGSTYVPGSVQRHSVGTSFAAPQVSGAVALLLETRPSLTPAAVRSLLMSTARSFPAPSGTARCHVSNGVRQDECYCTTLTCGAGMLDVQAAVQAAASSAVAVITVMTDTPQAGHAIQLSAAQSLAASDGGQINSYQWTLLDGGGIVSSTGWNATSPELVVTPSAAGYFHIRLTVDDGQGPSHVDQWIVVAQPGATAVSTSSSGGGGGGSVTSTELLALGLLLLGLNLSRTRRTIKA
ncbi:MAG: S8 family serine peptidase [Aquabacterium sp.]|uniref:S8 family serine peptidase n=1 Tax=Aquabacterium sp. TaxID=1872578 RepID=UPI0025BFD205|nr:S8 family serine peptidase [Aquabacterium sp.]MBI5924429.1 S8 family serine peptidase [Aquabacterium sp.]